MYKRHQIFGRFPIVAYRPQIGIYRTLMSRLSGKLQLDILAELGNWQQKPKSTSNIKFI